VPARPGTDSAIFRLALKAVAAREYRQDAPCGLKNVDATNRNPTLLFLLSGLFLLRTAQRTLL
jgi:hypothetical protein